MTRTLPINRPWRVTALIVLALGGFSLSEALALQGISGSLLSVFPQSRSEEINPAAWNYTQTNALDLSGSTWDAAVDENDVYHAALKHTQPSGPANREWEIRIGRGGQIYSIVSEVGEVIPPQAQNNPGSAPWVDEVFQSTSVDTRDNPDDVTYFYHHSGYYVDGNNVTEPVYSPMFASGVIGSNAYGTLTLGVQPQTDDPQQASGVLNWQRTKDLGDGVVEVTNGVYNFGDHTLNFHNMPWAGSRYSVFDHMLVADAGGGFTTYADETLLPFGTAQTAKVSETGGWAAFSEGTAPTDRGLAVVFGNATQYEQRDWETSESRWRWGDASAGGTSARDFLVGSQQRRVDVDPGEFYFSRYYMVLGDLAHIESTIADNDLVQNATHDKQEFFTDSAVTMLPWRVVTDGGVTSVEQTTSAQSHFKTFGQPVSGSKPLFLLEDAATGDEFLSIDPYVLSPFPYDGATIYKGLLGFVLPSDLAAGVAPYVDLASMFPVGSGFYLESASAFVAPGELPPPASSSAAAITTPEPSGLGLLPTCVLLGSLRSHRTHGSQPSVHE